MMSSSTDQRSERARTNKYLFDNAFDSLVAVAGTDGQPEIYTRQDLAAAREDGIDAGRKQMQLETENLVAQTLALIARQLPGIEANQQQVLCAVTRDAVELALIAAKKLALAITETQPITEIEAIIADCLERLRLEPRIVVRVNDGLLDPLNARIEEISEQCGFDGKVVLIGDEGIAPTDCQIEWSDGGTERNQEEVGRNLDAAVARLLTAGIIEPSMPRPEPSPAAAVPSDIPNG
jgi:flagellar assembly protein FliH